MLSEAPEALWPLVPLTEGGKSTEAVKTARKAILRSRALSSSQRADLLATLWFLAEAEKVPVTLLRSIISEEFMMRSTLYESIIRRGEERGEKRGRLEGEKRGEAKAIVALLEARLGTLPNTVRTRVMAETRPRVLAGWFKAATQIIDRAEARALVARIRAASPPLPAKASRQAG